jgi:4-hydroxy-tetrahydrodipicolinate reductase
MSPNPQPNPFASAASTHAVVLCGATGKMGSTLVEFLKQEPSVHLWATTAQRAANEEGQDLGPLLHQAPMGVPCFSTVANLLTHKPLPTHEGLAVGVDLTHPSTVFANAMALVEAGIAPVLGATGLSTGQQHTLHEALVAKGLPGLYVPNFAIGAVLLMRFAAQAAHYFGHAEVIELHHNQKADAPSGTALRTAEMMEAAAGKAFGATNAPEHESVAGARGALTAGGLRVHSVRLPGLVAHQEVLLADVGQLLTLRHDSFDRRCFMPGIVLCIKRIATLPAGLHVGLEPVMDAG